MAQTGKMDEANRAAERFAWSTRESFETMVDHVVGLQERNVRFAQELVDRSIRELRSQAESNQAMTQELLERAEHGREALEGLARESVDAYLDLAYAPLTYYKESLEAARRVAAG